MNKKIIPALLLLVSLNIYAQTSIVKTQKGPFGIDWNLPTACSEFKLKYSTIKISRDDDIEELQVVSAEKHFPGSDLIQFICAPGNIMIVHVRIPKIRTDGSDLAALYEELSRDYELDLVQRRQTEGNINLTFKAKGVRVLLNDEISKEYRSVTFQK